jgi:signal transduction histidine kinase
VSAPATTGRAATPAGRPTLRHKALDPASLWSRVWGWDAGLALVAVVSAAVALLVTINSDFLAYPYWLGVQKADLIVGPVFVGLYWRHRRPHNRLGSLLIALGLLGIPYILESLAAPDLFGVGVMWEEVIYPMTVVVILAFPNGRLEGLAERLILGGALLGVVLPVLIATLSDPHFTPSFSISGCRVACPRNGAAVFSQPSWLPQLSDFRNYMSVAVPVSMIGLYAWRWITARPPRRRALAIGAPIAVLFLVMQASYRTLFIVAPHGLSISAQPIQSWLQWTFAGSRALIWYGFLFALIGAELFAGRTLRSLVGNSLRRPSLEQLERMVREPLGDPGLRLGFWRPGPQDWVDATGAPLAPPEPGQMLTELESDGLAVAIVCDEQLGEDPELLQAAGTVALLALENAELDAGWNDALVELRAAQVRIVRAGNDERQRVERNLHDGVQQRLVAVRGKLGLARGLAAEGSPLIAELETVGAQLEEAIDELRDVAHGIYPPLLREGGLPAALQSIKYHTPIGLTVRATDVGRHPPELESAVYYVCVEAIQNVDKYGGAGVRAVVELSESPSELRFDVTDDGPGFDATTAQGGSGLQNMHDRLSAVGGHLTIVTAPGDGTIVRGSVPLDAEAGRTRVFTHSEARLGAPM